MKFWPGRDVKAELPNDDPKLKKEITSCSTLVGQYYSKGEKHNLKFVEVEKGHCIGFALYQKAA